MAKIHKTLTERSDLDRSLQITVNLDIDVNKDGLFTTTLKPEDVKVIESYGISLDANRVGRPGYFKDETMAGLCAKIREILKACVNYKIVSRQPIIKYYIDTICSYCLHSETGDICPNGYYTGDSGEFAGWKEGTAGLSMFEDKYFGMKFYAEPFMKVEVEYGNGHRKFFLEHAEWGKGTNMQWLADVPSMRTRNSYPKAKEIEGTEDNAKFFVNLIKSLCPSSPPAQASGLSAYAEGYEPRQEGASQVCLSDGRQGFLCL